MKELTKNNNFLLHTDGVVLDHRYSIPDFSINAGDVLWLESEHELYSEIFVSILLGLLKPQKGLIFLSGKSNIGDVKNVVSFLSSGYWLPDVENINTFLKIFASSLGIQLSVLSNLVKNNLEGLGALYAFDMKIKEMKPWTKRRVVTALTLSVSSLLIVLIEPFQGLDKNAAIFLNEKINNLKQEGSALILLCSDEPLGYSMHVNLSKVG